MTVRPPGASVSQSVQRRMSSDDVPEQRHRTLGRVVVDAPGLVQDRQDHQPRILQGTMPAKLAT